VFPLQLQVLNDPSLNILAPGRLSAAQLQDVNAGLFVDFSQAISCSEPDCIPDFVEFYLSVETGATAAPEPASFVLVGFGLAGAAAARVRRRSKTARS
jgi:hypothetical protein